MNTAVLENTAKKKVPTFKSTPTLLKAPLANEPNPDRDFKLKGFKSTPPELKPPGHPTSTSAQLEWKRALDLSCIFLSLPFTLPLMLCIVLWVRLVSRGPALYTQKRIGQNGRPFVLYKFRSMKLNAATKRHETYLKHLVKSDIPMIKLDLLCDSRLIPGGCLLRAAGLDELPQLLNVLRGEMSLVGPRPCLPQEYVFFSERQRERFNALPGLTGNWQVNGKNQTTFSQMNMMDVEYVRNSSLLVDLFIMMRTPAALAVQMCQAAKQHRKQPKGAGFTGKTETPYQSHRLG